MKKLLLSLILTLFVSTTSFADMKNVFKHIPEGETLIAEKQTYSDFSTDDYPGIFGVEGTLILNNVTFKNNDSFVITLSEDALLKIGDDSSFTSNTGGTIWSKKGYTVIGNNVEFNSNADPNYYMGTIVNEDGTLSIKNNVKFLNNFNSSEMFGGAIENCFGGNTLIYANAQFIDNGALNDGGAIYNGFSNSDNEKPVLDIYKGALFDSNAAKRGGAIYNDGSLAISGVTKFINNTANDYGGAIYNHGDLQMWADCEDIVFNGNTANGVSNAIHDNEGTITLMSNYGSNIIFNDRITSENEYSEISIEGLGKTIFNEDMSGYNGKIYLESGSTLQLGYDGKISNTSLKSNDGTLNLINGKINDSADVSPTFFSGYAFLEIDATLSGNSSIGDKFAPISADFHNDGNNYYYSGVTLTNVNITNNLITDNTGTFTVISASNGPCPNLYADLKVTQNGKTIKFTENQTSLNDTLNDTDIDYEILPQAQTFAQVISDATSYKVYNLSNNEMLSQNLGNLEGKQLIINGNGYDITSNGKKGMSVYIDPDNSYDEKTLRLENIKTISGFSGYYGAVVDNYSLTKIGSNITFENNTVLYNGGVFYGNKKSYMHTGDNITFRNNTANSGGVLQTEQVSVTIFGGNILFESNTADRGGAINNQGGIDFEKNATFVSNQGYQGSAIYNDNDAEIFFRNGAKFINNNNSAIYNYGSLKFFAMSEDIEFTGNDIAIFNVGGGMTFVTGAANVIFNDKLVSYDSDSKLWFDSYDYVILGIFDDFSKIILNADMSDYTGKININGAYVQLGENGTFFNSNCTYDISGATIDFANSVIQDYEFANSLKVTDTLNLKIDADLKNEKMDTITANNFSGDGKVNVTAINITKDSDKKEEISLDFITGNTLKGIVKSVDKAYSVMYEYDASYDKETGNMSFVRGKENPISNESAVSGLAGGYLSQVTVANQSFANIDNKVSQTRAAAKTPLYASANTNQVFEQGGSIERALWLRPYVVSDTVDVGADSKVDNTMYGTLAGIDLPAGKDKLLSFYLGYTGGKQEFNSVKTNQTNYMLGVTGTLIKDKWYLGATVNAGTNKVTADNDLGSDDIDNITYSLGLKTGYDFDLGKDFTLQPNIILMYIGSTSNDFTNVQGNKIEDDGISNILIQPGLRLDLSLANGWTPYGLFDVAINTGETSTKINGNKVKSLEMDPYFEYGVGVSKDFLNSPWSCYGQVSGKSGSRSGVGFNLGIKYAF